MKRFAIAAALLTVAACTNEQTTATKDKVVAKVHNAVDAVTVPSYAPDTNTPPRDQQRFDQHWRDLQSFRAAQQQKAAAAAAAAQEQQQQQAQIQFVKGKKQTF